VRDSDAATLESVFIFDGPYDEQGACAFVSDEFPDICTCVCEDENEDEPLTAAPTVSPTSSSTSSLTTVSPTASPTAFPTSPPTADSSECRDSPLDARVNNQDRDCDWIVDNGKCTKNKFKFHCRASCDKCDQCKDSKVNFVAVVDGAEEILKCAQDVDVDDDEARDRLCADGDIAATCPKTCGLC